MGGAERALLEPVPVERAVVVADDETDGTLTARVPTAPKPGAVLGAVKDKPCGRACARP
jgi:hypothetical protein